MLLSLSVKNLALIENAEVDFGEGLNVFTGETGAGKSLVIGSVNLALGGRAKGNVLRDEDTPAETELVFDLKDPEKLKVLEEMDIPVEDDGIIIIHRKITTGRNTAKVNGKTVTNAELKEVGSLLLDVHAQSEHQSLLYEKNHLLFLDKYAGEEAEKAGEDYRRKYGTWRKLSEELSGMEGDEGLRQREAELIEFEIKEIEEAGIRAGEDHELEDRFMMMNNSKKMAVSADEAYNFIFGENESASALVERALRAMTAVSGFDKGSEKLYNELNDIDSLFSDLKRDLDLYISSLDYSPEEYNTVVERLDLYNKLKMKYGNTTELILSSLKDRQDRLEMLQNFDEHREMLKKEVDNAWNEMDEAAKKLSDIRKNAAVSLGRDMEGALSDLNFLEAVFSVSVEKEDSYTVTGCDRVFFMISTNPGEDMRPLKDVASGGELSRIMLALKTVLADMDDIGTMIFDEIDTGISGRTAQKVSESLLKLSKGHQVILITHLPQIAAMADSHFLIDKGVEGGRTRTQIHTLNREDMIKELGRMLSGAYLTDTVLDNAREMKDLADKNKK